MVWNQNLEDYEYRKRRVEMYQKQHLSHDAISEIFEHEVSEKQRMQIMELEKTNNDALVDAQNQLKIIQEIEELDNKDMRDELVASKKIEILEMIQSQLEDMQKTYELENKLAYHLRKEVFDKIPPNTENSIIIIVTQNGDKWGIHVTHTPNLIDVKKIYKINVVMNDDEVS